MTLIQSEVFKMNFEVVFKVVLSNNENFIKSLTVSKCISCESSEEKYVNIRTYWKKGNEEIPTRNGVCLRKDEFRDVLINIESSRIFQFTRNNRTVELKRSEKPYLYELTLTKIFGDKQRIVIIEKEFKELIRNKEFILNSFNL